SASRPYSSSRCAEPPPRPPDRSKRMPAVEVRVPHLCQRAGGLRCSRLHSDIVLGFRFCIAPHLLGGAGFPVEQRRLVEHLHPRLDTRGIGHPEAPWSPGSRGSDSSVECQDSITALALWPARFLEVMDGGGARR